MITSLKGELIMKAPDYAEIECHGVGYGVHISHNTYGELPSKGTCRLLVDYLVSVDVRSGASEHKLFGFAKQEERALFRKLIGVQGVSSAIGMSMLGAMKPGDLVAAICGGDVGALKAIKGIGPKLAQRVIGELAKPLLELDTKGSDTVNKGSHNTLRSEALSALISLGMDRIKAERALQGVLNDRKGEVVELEDLIKTTLKNLN